MPLDYAQALASVEKIQKKSKEFKLPLGQKPKINATTDALISLLSPIHKTDPSIDEELIESFIATFESANIEYADKNNMLPLESFFSGLAEDYNTLEEKMTAAIQACQSCPLSPTFTSSSTEHGRSNSDDLKSSSSSQSDNNSDDPQLYIAQLISTLESQECKSAISDFFHELERKDFDEGTVIPILNNDKVINALNTNSKIAELYNGYTKKYGSANSHNLLFLISKNALLSHLEKTQEGRNVIASIMSRAILNGLIDPIIAISGKINGSIFLHLLNKLSQSNENIEMPVNYLRKLFETKNDQKLSVLIAPENLGDVQPLLHEILAAQWYGSNAEMAKMLQSYLITTKNHERYISGVRALLILSNKKHNKKAQEIGKISEAVSANHTENTWWPCLIKSWFPSLTGSRLEFILSQQVQQKKKRTNKLNSSSQSNLRPSR